MVDTFTSAIYFCTSITYTKLLVCLGAIKKDSFILVTLTILQRNSFKLIDGSTPWWGSCEPTVDLLTVSNNIFHSSFLGPNLGLPRCSYFIHVQMSLSTCQALRPDPARVSLVDLLLEGQLQSHLRALDDGLTTEQLVDTSGTRLSSLPAITYIDSDWNICSLTYADIVEYCKLVSEQLNKLVCNASANITIWNVSTDEGESACFTIPPVLVLYGDAAQWTPLFMIAANHVSLAFYSVDKPEQLKSAFGQLPNSTLGAFICHKYRYNELNCLLADQFDGETLLKTELLQDYYLLHFPSVNCSTQKDTAVSINLEIAYLINTSGTSSSITAGKDSTQIPVPASKSIFVPHGAITQNILDFREEYSLLSNDSVFISSPFTFDPSLCDIFYSLSVYAHLVLASSTLRHSALNVRRIFRQFGITYTTVTPSFWRKLTSVGPSPSELLRSLRYLNFGGEQSLPVEEIKLSILSVNENIRVYNLYGLTEVSAWASICSLNDNLDQLNDIMGKRLKEEQYYLAFIPILGRPLRDTAVYLEDGQLVIESTQRRCLILTCEQKWIYKSKYYTGDRGHRIVESDDLTYLYFVKRNCQLDFVKINGVKCYLPFIELSIQQHFLLSKVFTVTHCTALAGDWHEMKQLIVDLVVQIQPLQGKQLSAEEVERSILQHLSSQPFAFRIRLLDKSSAASILSSNGKLDIGKLRQHLKTAMQPKTTPLVTEQCEIESTILSIIALVLGIDLEFLKSNLDKELRHLGAASMSALQICLQIEQSLFGSLNTQSVSLFETVINSDIRSIIYFVHHLATMPTSFSSHNSTVELSATLPTGTQNSINEIVPPIEDASLSAVAFSLSRHSQLRKIVQLKASPIPLPEAVSFTHQWSVFMEECVDATPLIVQNGTVVRNIKSNQFCFQCNNLLICPLADSSNCRLALWPCARPGRLHHRRALPTAMEYATVESH